MISILTPDAGGLQHAERQRVPVVFENKCTTTQVDDQISTRSA